MVTEAGPTVLLWAISIGSFLEAMRTRQPWAWCVAGLTGGLGLYFYPMARLWALGAALTCVVVLLHLRDRKLLFGFAIAAYCAMIASAPFLLHLLRVPQELAARYLETTIFDPNNQIRLS